MPLPSKCFRTELQNSALTYKVSRSTNLTVQRLKILKLQLTLSKPIVKLKAWWSLQVNRPSSWVQISLSLVKTSHKANKQLWNGRSEEHTSELQSRPHLVCRLLLEKKKNLKYINLSHLC